MALRRVQGEEREDEEKAGDESGGGTSHGGRRGARRPQAGVDLCAQEEVEGWWEEHSIGLLLLVVLASGAGGLGLSASGV